MKLLELTGQNMSLDRLGTYWLVNKGKKPLLYKDNYCGRLDEDDSLKHIGIALSSGKEIEAIIYGKGETLLLIPGLGMTAPIWFSQLEELSRDYQVVVVHQPGHGFSETTDDLSYRGLSMVINEVLDQLNIKKPIHLVGACFGSLIAINYAILFPERLSSLILTGTIVRWDANVFNDSPLNRERIKSIVGFLNSFDKNLKEDYTAPRK